LIDLPFDSYLEVVEDPESAERDKYFADNVTFNRTHIPPQALLGLMATFRRGFPDLEFVQMGPIAEGDHFATWGFFEGNHEGEFNGVPATGKHVRWFGVGVDRIENGQVVELWHEMDTWGLMEQLRVGE
jgi:predicted ester cyclase